MLPAFWPYLSDSVSAPSKGLCLEQMCEPPGNNYWGLTFINCSIKSPGLMAMCSLRLHTAIRVTHCHESARIDSTVYESKPPVIIS